MPEAALLLQLGLGEYVEAFESGQITRVAAPDCGISHRLDL